MCATNQLKDQSRDDWEIQAFNDRVREYESAIEACIDHALEGLSLDEAYSTRASRSALTLPDSCGMSANCVRRLSTDACEVEELIRHCGASGDECGGRCFVKKVST